MQPRASFAIATLVLAICFACQVAEIFDQWDHTLQTGDDTEYTFVVLALCVGVAYSLKWFVPGIVAPDSRKEVTSDLRCNPFFLTRTTWSSAVPISPSPPAASLRI